MWKLYVEFLLCDVVLGVLSSLAIILLSKRESVVLLQFCLWLSVFCSTSSRCRSLQSAIVAFPSYTCTDFLSDSFTTKNK